MNIPEHPEIARCLVTGYPGKCEESKMVECCDCETEISFDDSYDWDGDLVCAECLEERIKESFNIEDIAKLIGVHHPIQIAE